MAEGKKSFVLYCDLIHTVSKIPDEKAGQLFKHILDYVNDKNPMTEDLIINIAFEPIKQQLKRDLVKYNGIVERNRVNGANGGRPRNPKKPSGLFGNPGKPKKADNDNDNDNVSEKKWFIPPSQWKEFLNSQEDLLMQLSRLGVDATKAIDDFITERQLSGAKNPNDLKQHCYNFTRDQKGKNKVVPKEGKIIL